jgi:hypothetical protein
MLTWEWYGDTNTFRVFMHILLKAQYKPVYYKGVYIDSGECVFGRKAWAKELGMSEQSLRTALAHLKSTNEITMVSTNKFSVIHVVKWKFWQIQDGLSTNEPTNDYASNQPTTNQQLTTSKESKKVRIYSINNNRRTQDMTTEEKDEFLSRALAKYQR